MNKVAALQIRTLQHLRANINGTLEMNLQLHCELLQKNKSIASIERDVESHQTPLGCLVFSLILCS